MSGGTTRVLMLHLSEAMKMGGWHSGQVGSVPILQLSACWLGMQAIGKKRDAAMKGWDGWRIVMELYSIGGSCRYT